MVISLMCMYLQWASNDQNVYMRGKSGSGDGVHVMTGPVYVCGSEPGDVLQIDILDLKPRANPSTGKTYGTHPVYVVCRCRYGVLIALCSQDQMLRHGGDISSAQAFWMAILARSSQFTKL